MPKIILHQSEFPTLLLVRAILMRNVTTLHSDLRHLKHLIKVTKRSASLRPHKAQRRHCGRGGSGHGDRHVGRQGGRQRGRHGDQHGE